MGVVKNKISTVITGYKVNLEIPEPLTLITGNSGTGKSLLFKHLDNLSYTDKSIFCINSYICEKYAESLNKNLQDTLLEMIKRHKNSLIIIDNADTLFNDNIRKYIGFDLNNQYLIFGRNVRGLWINENRIARLIRNDETKTIYLDYLFKDVNRKI
jgi:energy-coupling factor transporter ATP-binding protein EcfA2